MKLDRAWIGAPDAGAWANPTVWLFIAASGLLALGSLGYLSGRLPAAVVVPLNTLAIFWLFTVMHEGVHRVAHREARWNDALARLSALPLTFTFPMFRAVHNEHHAHTNDLARDPDFIVARAPRWAAPLWFVGVIVEYRLHFYGRRLWRSQADLVEGIAMDAGIALVLVGALVTGTLPTLFVVWLGPALVAVLLLAFAFDFLPHYPFDTAERYFDTRIYPGRVLNAVLLGQNYHLIHHLWTTIPWYRYRGVFAQIGGELAANRCRIGWRVAPLPDGVAPLPVEARVR
ncbi:MAG: fatty acid desaturase [bacterium]